MSRDTVVPFPYAGGKNSAAPLVWAALEGCHSYIEPCCGSAAVLMARPKRLRFETINDASGLVVNFHRSCVQDPDTVALWCNRIRSEIELVACGRWLLAQDLSERLKTDPSYCDPRAAGLWAWYLSASISPAVKDTDKQQPRLIRQGVMGDRKRDILPEICRNIGLLLQDVRILCGPWQACLGKANQQEGWKTDPIGVFFDPPYKGFEFYNEGEAGISDDVRAWCLAHGTDPAWHIVLCGYVGEHDGMPGWRAVPWQTQGRVSRTKQEVLWLSPHCQS